MLGVYRTLLPKWPILQRITTQNMSFDDDDMARKEKAKGEATIWCMISYCSGVFIQLWSRLHSIFPIQSHSYSLINNPVFISQFKRGPFVKSHNSHVVNFIFRLYDDVSIKGKGDPVAAHVSNHNHTLNQPHSYGLNTYDTFSVVVECWVSFWSDFQNGSRVLKKVL